MNTIKTSHQIQDGSYKALERGINPYPRLTMKESRRLIQLMQPLRSYDIGQQLECQQLQRKACGTEGNKMNTIKSLLTIRIEELQDKVAFLMEAIVEIQNTPAPGKRRRLAIKALEKIIDWDNDSDKAK